MKHIIIILILSLFPSCGLYYVAKPQVKTINSESDFSPTGTLMKNKYDATVYYYREDGIRRKIYSDYAIIRNNKNAPESFKAIKRIPKNSSFVIMEYIRKFDGQHVWYYVKFESTENHLKQYKFVRMIGRSQHEVQSSLDDFTWWIESRESKKPCAFCIENTTELCDCIW